MEYEIDLGQFWWEQYPKLRDAAAQLIETERTRVITEAMDHSGAPEDQTWYEDIRTDIDNGFNHGTFAALIINGLNRHYEMFDDKQAEKWRGRYDDAYGQRCRAYEALLAEGAAICKWIDGIEDADFNLLPEPAIVAMMVSGVIEKKRPGQVDYLLKQLGRFRPPRPKRK